MLHIPVLLNETIESLKIKPGAKYIDGTFGLGGHSKVILQKGGVVLGLDADLTSLTNVKKDFAHVDNLTLVHSNFRHMAEVAKKNGLNHVSGVLLDLGLSSWQLEHSGRGFSFQKEEQLDMRMDPTLGVTASDILKVLNKGDLNELFTRLGEESLGRDLGLSVIRARGIKEIKTTNELVALVGQVYRERFHGKSKVNPATKVFQALRIAVNDELNALREGLEQARELLSPGGRLAVISFHSLEDRIVKEHFLANKDLKVLTKKPIIASEREIEDNPRSRSAKLRVAEKI